GGVVRETVLAGGARGRGSRVRRAGSTRRPDRARCGAQGADPGAAARLSRASAGRAGSGAATAEKGTGRGVPGTAEGVRRRVGGAGGDGSQTWTRAAVSGDRNASHRLGE